MSTIYRNLCNTAAALALAAAAFTAAPARAEQANLNSMSFTAQPVGSTIRIISTDGQKWDQLKAGPVGFNGHMNIDTKWPGFVADVAVVLGSCGPNQCGSFPSIWSALADSRDYENTEVMSFDASALPVSSATGIATIPFADQAIRRCNEHLQPDGPTKSYSFIQGLDLTFAANTGIDHNMNNNVYEAEPGEWPFPATGMDKTAHAQLPVQVICEPVIKSPTNDVAADLGEFDVENVKLFLTTYQSTQPGSNPGTVCPAFKVTSRAETSKAGPVAMRIWRQKDGGPITSTFHEAWASYDPAKNGYFATYERFENVGTTSYFQFKVEIVDPTDPFAPFDGWKDITVHCTSPGGGGFTNEPRPDNDLPQPQAKWDGEIAVSDSAGRDKSCPRKGQVSFNVSRQAPGDFDYRISCSNGAYFEGTATGFADGAGGFAASGAHQISVNRTRSIQCTLQEMTPAPVTVDVDKDDFTCANPNFDPAADDIVSSTNPRPTHPDPVVPPVVVDPGKTCLPSQKRVRGKCVDKPVVQACKANERLVRGKCIGVSIHCLPGFVQVGLECVKKPDVSILCKPGFELKGKTCVRKPVIVEACKRNQVRIGGKCVKKPDVSILCKPGFELKGKTCVRKPVIGTACAKNEKVVRGNCVPVKPIIKTLKVTPKLVLPKPVRPALKAARTLQPKAILPFKRKLP